MTKGYILETSPLPKLPVTGLESVPNRTQESFDVCLDHQSAEEESVNGTKNLVKYEPAFSRYPFILLLDGIVSILLLLLPSRD
jgi:21S rRNA (GM2251-2'-O)-methyltransferase